MKIFYFLFLWLSWFQCNFCWTGITPLLLRRSRPKKIVLDASSSSHHDQHVWKAIDRLDETMHDHPLTPIVLTIMRKWASQWNDNQSLLNNKNLLHEIEESMVALGIFIPWLDSSISENNSIILMDVCCGKGIFSLLASYVFQNDSRVSKVIMIDKPSESNNEKNKNEIDWSHIDVANKYAKEEKRPRIEARKENLFETDKIIDWLTISEKEHPLAFIGIHLCKNLSPTFVGIANALGSDRVPFLCLAPCCLPRVVVQSKHKKDVSKNMLQVATYEAPLQRQARLREAQLRHNAKQRHTKATKKCHLCQSTNHTVHKCDLLASYSSTKRSKILEAAASLEPCWKCGELGHKKKDCLSRQTSSLPTLISKPILERNVSHIMYTENPFSSYCDLLSTSIERDSIHVFESGLQNTESSFLEHGSNWNRERKTIFIVATSNL